MSDEEQGNKICRSDYSGSWRNPPERPAKPKARGLTRAGLFRRVFGWHFLFRFRIVRSFCPVADSTRPGGAVQGRGVALLLLSGHPSNRHVSEGSVLKADKL